MKKVFLFILLFLFSITSVSAATVATVDGEDCETLAEAIEKAPNNTQTTITLLQDQSENITIPSGKNIILDLNGHTLSNKGTDNKATVITNEGTLELKNGNVTTSAQSGMINNNDGAVLYITSGNYTATGTKSKQVLYNNKGTATISGTTNLEATSSNRAVVHNLNGGKLNIVGGTINSINGYAVYNDKGTLNIGTKNDEYVQTTPVIQGKTYGVIAYETFNVYDGIIKGQTYHIGKATSATAPTISNDTNETKINDYEEYSTKSYGTDGSYKTFTYDLDNSNRITITFDLNGGIGESSSRKIFVGNEIGTFPDDPIKPDNKFAGWYTEAEGGVQIGPTDKPSVDTTIYAHWNYVNPFTVAYSERLGMTTSLEIALAAGGNITLLEDVITTSQIEIHAPANIDLNGKTIKLINTSIIIDEEVTIDDKSSGQTGLITSNADFTIYVGEYNTPSNGKLIHKGGTIEGLGAHGAIRNYETTIIDGGTVKGTATDNGFVIYNEKELIMESGTVHSTNGRAIQVYENSTFTMNGGLVKSDAENDQTVNLYGNCSATINGGTIEGLNTHTAGIAMFGNTNLEVNGGTIKGYDMGIAGNGNEISANANITINGGDIIATNGVGMYLPQRNSTTTINGGNISGPTGIEIRAANLIINGGNITATNDTYEVIENSNGTTTKGAALAVVQHNTMQPINVIINGGNLKAIVPLAEANPMNNPDDAIDQISIIVTNGDFTSTGDKVIDAENPNTITQLVTGGTYTYDPISYVKDGYTTLKIDDKYHVVRIYKAIIDSSSTGLISTDKTEYLQDEIVLLTVQDKDGYNTVIEVKDENGNPIEVRNKRFTMPSSDVTIKVIYEDPNPQPNPINPKTGDFLLTYILMLLMSIVGILWIQVIRTKIKMSK